MKPHILVITFEGLLSPVFQNQFVSVLSALADQYNFTILVVEKQDSARRKLIACEREKLEKKGIQTISLPLLRLPLKLTLLVNVIVVALYALVLVPAKKVEIVHIRRYDAIGIALLLKIIYRTIIVFDPRGLFIDEKVTAGKWRKRGFQTRLSRLLEHKTMKESDAVISFSKPHSEFLKDVYQQMVHGKVTLIPNCVDLGKFKLRQEHKRRRFFKKKLTLIYIGGASYWHMLDEMILFFGHLKQRVPCFFMYLTYEDRHSIAASFAKSGLQSEDYCVQSVPHTRIAQYLSCADIGIALIEPSLAKKVCAPIKFVEYLASGLPVVINQGIGETEKVIKKYRVGVVYDRSNIEKNVDELLALLKDKDIHDRCRFVIERHYNLAIAASKLSKTYQRIQQSR